MRASAWVLLVQMVVALCLQMSGQDARAVPEPTLWWSFDDGQNPTSPLAGIYSGVLAGGGGGPRYLVSGAISGATLPGLDCNGDALRFDGNDYVEIAPGVAGLDGFSALTLSAWVRLEQYSGAIIAKYDTHNQWVSYYISVQTIPGKVGYVRALIGGAGGANQSNEVYVGADTAANAVPLNTWTHVAAVWSGGSNITIYVNGAAVPSTAFANGNFTGMYSGTTPISIGSVTSTSGGLVGRGDYLTGDLDDARIWNIALSAQDIAELAAGGGTVAACDVCPIECGGTAEVFFGVVRNSEGTLGSIQCWRDAGGIDCRTDVSGALLVGPPECAP